MPVSEYLTAYANRELYAVHASEVGGYLGVEGRHVKTGNDWQLDPAEFKRIRLLTGPGRGHEAIFETRYLALVR